MTTHLRLCCLLLGLIWGCDDAPTSAARDAAPIDMQPDAEVFEVQPFACPPTERDAPTRLELQAPGSWSLEGCSHWIEVHFTVPPRTAWHVETIVDPSLPVRAHSAAGENLLDTPAEITQQLSIDPDHPATVTIRWVECATFESCAADRYCARETYTCTDCLDGDELFDTRQPSAPRTAATPRTPDAERTWGVACAGADDWYEVHQPAGQPLILFEDAQVYVADPAAATLADLEPIPLVAERTFGLDAEPTERVVAAPEVDRTVWIRLTTEASHWPYSFTVGGCTTSLICPSWWYCDDSEVCQACDGVRDAHGDDDVQFSPQASPIPLESGQLLDGALCGADEDWYAVTLGDPASRISITDAVGQVLYADEPLEAQRRRGPIRAGSRMVLRRDAPHQYPDLRVPEVVWVNIAGDGGPDRAGTHAYSIRVEDGDFCDESSGCPAGRSCDGESGRCVDAE